MQDPDELLRRAAELSEKAKTEGTPEIRDRLLLMAGHYTHLAESERWLADHPTSIASIGDLFLTK